MGNIAYSILELAIVSQGETIQQTLHNALALNIGIQMKKCDRHRTSTFVFDTVDRAGLQKRAEKAALGVALILTYKRRHDAGP